MKELAFDLALIFLSDDIAYDACIERLLMSLGARRGIGPVYVDATDLARPRLCLHYEPTVVSIPQVYALVEQIGAQLRNGFEHL